MSSTFDSMQYALVVLSGRVKPDDEAAHNLIDAFKEVVDSLHDYSHQTQDAPHRFAARSAVELRRILRCDYRVG